MGRSMTPSRIDRHSQTSSDVVYELPPSQYHLVAPLFEEVWIDKAIIDSVIEGTEPARVFADEMRHPETVLMCCERGDYVIIGDTGQGPVRQFIKDMPSEAEVFNRERFAFFMPRIEWGDVLNEDFGGEIPIFATRSFRYSKGAIEPVERWQEGGIRDDARVQRIDRDMLDQIDRCVLKTGKGFTVRGQEGGEVTREDLAEIARDFFGFCTIVGDEIASVASVFGLSTKYASLGIDTTVHFRRQGLATLACVALIEGCLERGLTPLWNCLASNDASGKTALKLGMEEGPPQRESQWRPAWKHVRPSSGLWRRDDRVTDSQPNIVVWRRT